MSEVKLLSANVEIGLANEKLKLKLVLPADDIPPEGMLPGMHDLANQVMASVERKVEKAEGYAISCKKGCGACCRQYVPISPPEARWVHAIVENMPKDERIAMKRRFKEAALRLQDSGLLDTAMNYSSGTEEETIALIAEYFKQGIACPFLEDESCSIHTQRPLICREYLVTSSPEHCATLDKSKVKRLEPPLSVTDAFGGLDGLSKTDTQRYMPLIMALEWVERFPDDAEIRPGTEWAQAFFQRLEKMLTPDSEQD